MKYDVVLSGVGGQGILTIAKGLSLAAMEQGLSVKQAEVHGMSQRGGAVYSHVRLSDHQVYSELIPTGQADMLLAVEPLEALRYVQSLRHDGVVIANTNAVANIPDYPQIEEVLGHVAGLPQHVMLNMEKLARAAGSPLAANMVALGAASLFLPFSSDDLLLSIEKMFGAKGEKVVLVNQRAFRFGRNAASAYLEGVQRGFPSRAIRQWVETLSPEYLASGEDLEGMPDLEVDEGKLTGAEAHAFESILMGAWEDDRTQLFEHEVYRLIELVGAITPPRYSFVPKGAMISEEALSQYPGEKVVIKIVSPNVVHKSDVQAVLFAPKQLDVVRREIDQLMQKHGSDPKLAGCLVVEFVENARRGLGGELFVGVRSTREFGPVIAAGLGGLDTEYLAGKMRPGVAVAKAVATETSAEEFLELFKETAAHELLAGKVRGHERVVSDGELLRCFRVFISIARWFCVDRGEEGPDIGELEVNPFAYRNQRLVPLDGRGRLRTAPRARAPRASSRVDKMLTPKTIAVLGVSATSQNFGRIILGNILRAGFSHRNLVIIRDGEKEIDGVACVPSLAALKEEIDLLVIAAPSEAVPQIIREANTCGKVQSAIIISGGVGETEGTADLAQEVSDAILEGRQSVGGGVVFLGPNCMGIQSGPGKYDTFFIPEHKLDPRRGAVRAPVALISQSGAFVISRLSSLGSIEPAFVVSIGNQLDVTVADLLWSVSRRNDVKAVGVYLEGFADLDGAEFLRAAKDLKEQGKTLIFYKAGRNESGRSAASGHTAAVAGDYDVCQAAAELAGAIVAEDFKEFENLLELAALLIHKKVQGNRLFAVTNAGMEAVAMADAIGSSGVLSFPTMSDELTAKLGAILAKHKLNALVNPRNPLDLTPMANEAAYGEVVQALLASDEVDGLIVSCVPLTPQLKTTAEEIGDADSIAKLIPKWAASSSKPLLFVADAGRHYDALADSVREGGVPVFRNADAAAKALARYWSARSSDSRALSTLPS